MTAGLKAKGYRELKPDEPIAAGDVRIHDDHSEVIGLGYSAVGTPYQAHKNWCLILRPPAEHQE
jgi:hypothetical protein